VLRNRIHRYAGYGKPAYVSTLVPHSCGFALFVDSVGEVSVPARGPATESRPTASGGCGKPPYELGFAAEHAENTRCDALPKVRRTCTAAMQSRPAKPDSPPRFHGKNGRVVLLPIAPALESANAKGTD